MVLFIYKTSCDLLFSDLVIGGFICFYMKLNLLSNGMVKLMFCVPKRARILYMFYFRHL